MPNVDLTFERGGKVLRILARVSLGWTLKQDTFAFFGRDVQPFVGDTSIKVQVRVAARPNEIGRDLSTFPEDLRAECREGPLLANLSGGNASFSVSLESSDLILELCEKRIFRVTPSHKPEIYWEVFPFGTVGQISLAATLWVIWQPPRGRPPAIYREWGLPDHVYGQFEANRRRH